MHKVIDTSTRVNKEIAAANKPELTIRTDFDHPHPLSVTDVSLHTVPEEDYVPSRTSLVQRSLWTDLLTKEPLYAKILLPYIVKKFNFSAPLRPNGLNSL